MSEAPRTDQSFQLALQTEIRRRLDVSGPLILALSFQDGLKTKAISAMGRRTPSGSSSGAPHFPVHEQAGLRGA